MTPERQQEIRALLDAATPGPWEYTIHSGRDTTQQLLFVQEVNEAGAIVAELHFQDESEAALIAAAPTIIAELLAENERLQRALAAAAMAQTDRERTG